MYALNASTGVAVWTRSLGAIFSVPAVAHGVVYVGVGFNVNAIDANTGVVLWLSGTKGSVNSSAAVADGVVYFGSWDDGLYAANAQTGVELWRYTTGDSLSSSPTVANGMVYVGSRDGNIYAFGPVDADNHEPHSEDHPDFGTLHPDLTLQPSIAVVSADK
jgi:glucose dehydrogenase